MATLGPDASGFILTEKRKPRCFPKKLNPIKNGFAGKDFPSKMRVFSETSAVRSREDFGESGSFTEKSVKPICPDKPPITTWRIANCNDVAAINSLIDKSDHVVDELFSTPDIPNLIEKSSFALVQFNSNNEMVSFTSAFAHPNIPAVPSFEWYSWFSRMYQVDDISPRNTFYLHFMIWRSDYHDDFLGLSLETLFMEFPFLKNIIIIKPPMSKTPDFINEYFMPVLPNDAHVYKWDSNSVQTLLLCLRHSLLERLKIRLAIVEDHDDLMPIIESQTGKLRELYGDFCMAEIIEYPGTEDRKTLVCEVSGYAVAFMNLNRAVDLELLNTQFDLGVFHGLRKPTDEDKSAECLEDNEEIPFYIPEKLSPSFDMINSETMEAFVKWRPTVCRSQEDLKSETSSAESDHLYDLPSSVVELIKDAMNAKITPKFSAYALGSAHDSDRSTKSYYNSDYGEESETVKTELSLISLQYYNLPEYHGPPNAFCIELFAVHEDFDEKLCSDFLEAAFELFPDLEYCLLTIPSQCTAFPLLDLFVRVTPRPLKRFKQELYVCHKSSVMLTFMGVRRVNKSDLKEIYQLLKGIRNRDYIYADIANSCVFPDSAYQSFVLICNETIVGAAVVCNENGLEYLTEHYHVGELIDFELHKMDYHAIIKHLTLSPIFNTHARFFLRDIMRMADITALYRARYEDGREIAWNRASLITALGQFVPVRPRRMVNYHQEYLGKNVPPPYLLNLDIPFSLYHINSRICGLPKFTSNINLVVVGTSRTAYSFLENLLYAPNSAYVTYNNITWVSPHGTGSDFGPHPARDLLFPYKGKYDQHYRSQISLRSFVNVVYGVMTHIDRTEKYIKINNDAILRYDYLLLMCGRQYLMPVPLVREVDTTKCARGGRPRCSLFKYLINQKIEAVKEEAVAYPSNVFLINSVVDATNAIISVQYLLRKRRFGDTNEKIVIYGSDISVYLCIQCLLKFEVPAEMIVLVEPTPKKENYERVFLDPNIDAAVARTLNELNILRYRDYILYDWHLCENQNQISSATFHSKHNKVTLKCMAMFPFEEKLVSDVTFKAVNEASLVYDGRLVINNKFQTNDPYIYAAGSLTKYQRKYYANDKNHEYFDANEVGKLVAEVIRTEIDPTEESKPTDASKEELVPEMKSPVMICAQLPGDWNYMNLRAPGKMVPLEAQCNIKEFGDALITGDCQMSNGYGYFRIHLDDFGFVQSITCYTRDEIDKQNLRMLYGKHEKYLNNLLYRFNSGLITDFFAYFRQPWVYALYHDRFQFLMNRNKECFTADDSSQAVTIMDMIDDALKDNKWERPDDEKLTDIREAFESSIVKANITKNVVDYISTFRDSFPMYATPGILQVLLHEAGSSLLHKSVFRDTSTGDYKPSIEISNLGYHI